MYSGIPEIKETNVVVKSHDVTLEVGSQSVEVASTTVVSNKGAARTFLVALRQEQLYGNGSTPKSALESYAAGCSDPFSGATWDGGPLQFLTWMSGMGNVGGSATVKMPAHGTSTMRVKYKVPLSLWDASSNQVAVAYSLYSPVSIRALTVSLKFGSTAKFGMVNPSPNLAWKATDSGVSLSLTDYNGKSGLSYFVFPRRPPVVATAKLVR